MSSWIKTFEGIAHAERLSLMWIAERRSPFADRLMRGFTRAGDWQTWTVLAIAALAAGPPFRAATLVILPRLLVTLALCYTIKAISRRPRPAKSMQGFSSLLKDPDPYSFPSSHSACAWVVCVSIGLLLGGGWPIWLGYASAISYSRVHVGAHYPLDVLMGTALGVVIALA